MTIILTTLFLLVMLAGCAAVIAFLLSIAAYIINLTEKNNYDETFEQDDE